MGLLDKIKNVIKGTSGGGGGFLERVANIADKFTLSPEEKNKFMQEMEKEANRHAEVMAELAQRETESYLKDMDSARSMQIEALKQDDKFAKRFIYFLAAGVIFLTFVFDMLLFWVKYPEANRDLINMVAGVLNTGALIMILQFFFGSSKSSEAKQEFMQKMMQEK